MAKIDMEGPMLVGVLWMFQCIAFGLVALRLYARLVVVQNYGWDDHCFNVTVVSLLFMDFMWSLCIFWKSALKHIFVDAN